MKKREHFRKAINAIMARIPASSTAAKLSREIDAAVLPEGLSEEDREDFIAERELALKDWARELPGLEKEGTKCQGGKLIVGEISRQKPIPIETEKRIQAHLIDE